MNPLIILCFHSSWILNIKSRILPCCPTRTLLVASQPLADGETRSVTNITQSSVSNPIFRLPQPVWWRWFRILASVPCRAKACHSLNFLLVIPVFQKENRKESGEAIEFPASHHHVEFSHGRHSFSLQLHHSFLVSCHSLNFEFDWRFLCSICKYEKQHHQDDGQSQRLGRRTERTTRRFNVHTLVLRGKKRVT